jgi:protoheme IX farnesyltransferase
MKPYLELAKIRLTAMVLVTTAVGFIVGASGPMNMRGRWLGLFWTILGTGLAAAGAAAMNQLLEIHRDATMRRTCRRPLPTGVVTRWQALLFALASAGVGVIMLNELVNPLTALLGLANVVIYALIYTPLKPKTTLNTLVGAICGALPPMMGWTAAANSLSLGALLMGLILFLWQVPHFLALAWLYRDEYAKAGFRMLPVVDPTGRMTCLMIVLYSLALLPLGLVVAMSGVAGYLFAAVSLVLGMAFFVLTLKLYADKSPQNARRVFLASLVYLPALMLFLVIDARPQGGRTGGDYANRGQVSPGIADNASSANATRQAVINEGDKKGTDVPEKPYAIVAAGALAQ